MFDKDRIKEKLSNLELYSKRLGSMAPKGADLYKNADIMLKSAIERNLQLVSDVELDILALLYKGFELKLSGDDLSLIESLSGKLSKKSINKIKERRTLRNLLIHAYTDSGYEKESFEQAYSTSDITEFIKEVKQLIA
ncbi:MAG: HepT-like ribonuclease domain-containing protein [Candidatus Micrarchaeaceae archaeon]